MTESVPQLVGHRGYPARYPENSLSGFRAAIDAGARHLEMDVQMCADGELVVLHDDNLLRTAGVDQSIFSLSSSQLAAVSVHQPARFGQRFDPEPLLRLPQMLQALMRHQGLRLYVEIKQESIGYFGLPAVMQKLAADLQPCGSMCVMISFCAEAVAWMQQRGGLRCGWVIERYDTAHRQRAQVLQPDWLVCDQRKVPSQAALWPGDWQWMLYGIETLALLQAAQQRGAALAESDRVGELLLEVEGLRHG